MHDQPSTEELYAATVSHSTRTAVEIELELKRLFGVVQAGFIADQEYSRRKKALEVRLFAPTCFARAVCACV